MNKLDIKEVINRMNEVFVQPQMGGTYPEPPVIGARRHYSIFVPIVERDGEPCLLFEVRSKDIDRQPGEVCFPGGMVEEGETFAEAAIRETVEELGLAEDKTRQNDDFVQICGQIGIMSQYQGSVIHCYYGTISEYNLHKLAPSKDEVAEIFYVPLVWFEKNIPLVPVVKIEANVPEDFPYERIFPNFDDEIKTKSENYAYNWGYGTMNVPIWNYEKYTIWGITGRIIKHILDNVSFFDR